MYKVLIHFYCNGFIWYKEEGFEFIPFIGLRLTGLDFVSSQEGITSVCYDIRHQYFIVEICGQWDSIGRRFAWGKKLLE